MRLVGQLHIEGASNSPPRDVNFVQEAGSSQEEFVFLPLLPRVDPISNHLEKHCCGLNKK